MNKNRCSTRAGLFVLLHQFLDCAAAVGIFCQFDEFLDGKGFGLDVDAVVFTPLFAAHQAGASQDVVPVEQFLGCDLCVERRKLVGEHFEPLLNRRIAHVLLHRVALGIVDGLAMSKAVADTDNIARFPGHVALQNAALGDIPLDIVNGCRYVVNVVDGIVAHFLD